MTLDTPVHGSARPAPTTGDMRCDPGGRPGAIRGATSACPRAGGPGWPVFFEGRAKRLMPQPGERGDSGQRGDDLCELLTRERPHGSGADVAPRAEGQREAGDSRVIGRL